MHLILATNSTNAKDILPPWKIAKLIRDVKYLMASFKLVR